MARPGPDLVPEFERRTAAAEAGIPYPEFADLPTFEQARVIAWQRARGWIASLEAWERVKGQ